MDIRTGTAAGARHMKWSNYLVFCLALSVVVSLAVLFVPGLSETIEAQLIGFLSTNAR